MADEVKSVFEQIKTNRTYRYVIYYIKDKSEVVVESKGDREKTYEDFFEEIRELSGESECRYGVIDLEYKHQTQGTSEASLKQKLILFRWSPDTANIKQKMLYASSSEALKKALVGIAKYVQATDTSEGSYENVLDQVRALDRN